jgi:hypothetical protein
MGTGGTEPSGIDRERKLGLGGTIADTAAWVVIDTGVVELGVEVEMGIVGGLWAVEEGVDTDMDASSWEASPLVVAVEDNGWMRSAGLGNVLYVDPRDVYL